MKKYFFIMLLFGQSVLCAQEIAKVEYFVDTDPGFGKASSATLGAKPGFEIDISTLGDGLHALYVRALDFNGRWSHSMSRLFVKQSFGINDAAIVSMAEYFIDTDPGLGYATPLGDIHGDEISVAVDVKHLDDGLHALFLRTIDSRGAWSHTMSRVFVKQTYALGMAAQAAAAEYFIDTDPGMGKASGIPLLGGGELSFVADVASLQNGLHSIYTRFADKDGVWSHTIERLFVKQSFEPVEMANITAVEYFIDTDPGVGMAFQAPFTQGSEMHIVAMLDGLNNGVHNLFVRTRDDRGRWSHTIASTFVKLDVANPDDIQITEAEYFIDNDPGLGKAAKIANISSDVLLLVAELDHLTDGLHSLSARVKDSRGRWSHVMERAFIKQCFDTDILPEVGKAEYFIDTDPGVGNGLPIAITTNGNGGFVADITPLAEGIHTLYIRAIDTRGKISHTSANMFVKSKNTADASSITYAEYYFNADPGMGNGVSISNIAGGSMMFDADLRAISSGVHTIFARTRDSGGRWSHPMSFTFVKSSISSDIRPNIVACEYYIDTDPGYGMARPLPIQQPAPSVVQELIVPLDGLSPGIHSLFVRSLDENGKWAMVQDLEFCSGPIASFLMKDTIVCGSDEAVFLNTTTNVGVDTKFSWDFDGDGTVDNQQNGDVRHLYPIPGSYMATLKADVEGLNCSSSFSRQVLVSRPSITVSSTQPDKVFVNQAVQFSSVVTGVSNNHNLLWNTSGGLLSDTLARDITFVADTPGLFVVSAVVTDMGMCRFIDNDTVEVLPLIADFITHDSMVVFLTKQNTIETRYLETNSVVTWKSSDPSVAMVSQRGDVVGMSPGSALITGTVNQTFSDYLRVEVNDYIPVEKLVAPQQLSLFVAESVQAYAVALPGDASIRTVSWFSSDSTVASVDETGLVKGHKTGTCYIVPRSHDNDVSAVISVNVNSNHVPVKEVHVPDTMYIQASHSKIIDVSLSPFNATNTKLTWLSSDNGILTVDSMGVATAKNVGQALVVVAACEGKSDTVVILVKKSAPPVLILPNTFTVEQNEELLHVNLSQHVEDDFTADLDIRWELSQAPYINLSVTNGILSISPVSSTWVGSQVVTFTAVDEDGSKVSVKTEIIVTDKLNQAPLLFFPDIRLPQPTRVTLYLPEYIHDDNTATRQTTISVVSGVATSAGVIGDSLVLTPYSESWKGTDTIAITVTDDKGMHACQKIAYSVALPGENKAPSTKSIPIQSSNALGYFDPLYLNRYVEDDATPPSRIKWSSSTSQRLRVSITNNVLNVETLDMNWNGSDRITLVATDEQGQTDTATLIFVKQPTTTVQWQGKPLVSFFSDRSLIPTNTDIQLFAQLSGAQSWKWVVYGPDTIEMQDLNPKFSFSTHGQYSVKLIAQNGTLVDSAFRPQFISVIDLGLTDTTICSSQSITLSVFAPGVDALKWSTGESSQSIVVSPASSQEYSVTAFVGLFKYNRKATVTVQQPISFNTDTSICLGANALIEAPLGFDSYQWSNGLNTRAISVSNESHYLLTMTDAFRCRSFGSVIVRVDSLPQVTLGEDKSICYGTPCSLSAPASLLYEWSTMETTPTISVSQSGSYAITVTDSNNCHNADTIDIRVLKPFDEQLCIATVSENGKSIVVAWERTSNMRTIHYDIYREGAGGYKNIGRVDFNSPSYFIDTAVDVNTTQYTYAIKTIDDCNNVSPLSPPHTSMHVQPFEDALGKYALRWNSYKGKNVEGYRILGGSSSSDMKVIEDIPPQNTSYTVAESNISQRYRVVALFGDTCYPARLKSDSGPYSYSLSNMAESEITRELSQTGDAGLIVFPNPTGNVLSIFVALPESSDITVEILTNDGKIESRDFLKKSTVHTITKTVGNLSPGIYRVVVTYGDKHIGALFTKE